MQSILYTVWVVTVSVMPEELKPLCQAEPFFVTEQEVALLDDQVRVTFGDTAGFTRAVLDWLLTVNAVTDGTVTVTVAFAGGGGPPDVPAVHVRA